MSTSKAAADTGAPADAVLVQRARAGKPADRHAAFALLVTRYEGFVRGMLRRLTGNA